MAAAIPHQGVRIPTQPNKDTSTLNLIKDSAKGMAIGVAAGGLSSMGMFLNPDISSQYEVVSNNRVPVAIVHK